MTGVIKSSLMTASAVRCPLKRLRCAFGVRRTRSAGGDAHRGSPREGHRGSSLEPPHAADGSRPGALDRNRWRGASCVIQQSQDGVLSMEVRSAQLLHSLRIDSCDIC